MSRLLTRLRSRAKDLEYRASAAVVIGGLTLLRRFQTDSVLDFADRWARRIGPWTPRQRVALDNLRHAFPEKSADEIAAIASDMWGNMGRLAAEYVFLDRLFDYEVDATVPGRIEVVGRDNFFEIRDTDGPQALFTGHMGNFELLAIAAQKYGLDMTALFRPPNNPYIARKLLSLRKISMGNLLPSRAGAAFSLARILARGGTIGALVDQKFNDGIRTNFFGRPCLSSPLVPRLARQYDPHVYPGRCIRLPGNRYRLEVEKRIDLPRTAEGEIDVQGSAQLLNDVVERWVREYPGQWMWFHRRWEIKSSRNAAKRKAALAPAQ